MTTKSVKVEEVVQRARPRVITVIEGPSLTRQEFKDECDLALILQKFSKTPDGLEAIRNAQGFADSVRFDDVSNIPDYRTARDLVNQANARFMALPAIVRRRFDNDPAVFLDFVSNPENLDEMRSLGLANSVSQPVNPGVSGSLGTPVKSL